MAALHNTFATIAKAREAINRHVLDNGESYQIYKTDTKRHILLCKDKSCSFTIRAWCTKKQVLLSPNSSHIPVALLSIMAISNYHFCGS
jgi:hypothetical protein